MVSWKETVLHNTKHNKFCISNGDCTCKSKEQMTMRIIGPHLMIPLSCNDMTLVLMSPTDSQGIFKYQFICNFTWTPQRILQSHVRLHSSTEHAVNTLALQTTASEKVFDQSLCS